MSLRDLIFSQSSYDDPDESLQQHQSSEFNSFTDVEDEYTDISKKRLVNFAFFNGDFYYLCCF
jgi:hypothetical protein